MPRLLLAIATAALVVLVVEWLAPFQGGSPSPSFLSRDPATPDEVDAARLQVAADAALTARTEALESLADRCVPALWAEAEATRDAASEAQLVGRASTSRAAYDRARELYTLAGLEATAARRSSACARDAAPTLRLPHSDDTRETRSASTATRVPERDAQAAPEDRSDTRSRSEVELRTRATRLLEQGRACEGAALLRKQGAERRTRELALALRKACRLERRTQ